MVATTGMHRTLNKFSEDLSFPAFSVSSFDDDYVASSSNILIINPMPMERRGLVGETREWCAFTAYSTDFIAISHCAENTGPSLRSYFSVPSTTAGTLTRTFVCLLLPPKHVFSWMEANRPTAYNAMQYHVLIIL